MSGFDLPWSRRLRPVLQAEAAECGLACLTMIAQKHRLPLSLQRCRAMRFFWTS